jgi:hypothetical protein
MEGTVLPRLERGRDDVDRQGRRGRLRGHE